jgi:hypothetical protein
LAETLSASQVEIASKFPIFWIVPTTANPLSVHGEQTPPRRFPPPWSVEEQAACFVVRHRDQKEAPTNAGA